MAERWRDGLALVRMHPRHVVLFALVAGLACGGWAPVVAAPAAVVALWVAARPAVALVAVVAVLGGVVLGQARRDAIDHGTLPVALGAPVDARLTVLEPLRERAGGELVARVAPVSGRAAGEPLLLRLADRGLVPAGGIEPGAVVEVVGRLAPLRRYDVVQRRRGALAAVEARRVVSTGELRGGLMGALDGVRRRAEAGLARGLPQEQSALLQGMTIGREDRIDEATRDDFRASGLAHLLAVSGTNVMLLAALVVGIASLLGAPLRARLGASLVLVALYVPLTGAGPSIQRAGVMGAAGLVAALAGRPASRWYALGLAAAVTLALNPYALADAGWQLSFAAVVGMMCLVPSLRAALERRRLPRPLVEAAAMTGAATLATAPLLALHFEQLSLVSLPANLVVAPVMAPLMWLGMLAAAVAQVSPAAALPFDVLNAPLVGFVDGVAHAAAHLPHAVVPVRLPGVAGAVAAYAAMGALWLTMRHGWRAWARLGARGRPAPAPVGPRGGSPHLRAPSLASRFAPAPALAVLVAAVVAATAPARGGPAAPVPGETVVSFLDVGQGDATLVQRDGAAVLFDTGPPEGDVLGRLDAIGVRRLDMLVITHAENDHEGAAVEVIERLHPRVVVDGGAGWPSRVQRALPRVASAAGARVVGAAGGDVLRLGDLELDVLWPPRALAEAPPSGNANDRALVVHLRSGVLDVLLTADAEANVTGHLDLPDVDVLKVAHHGSEDPGLPAELVQLRPEIAAISVGRGNTYGHPVASTLRALRVVPQVLRTDRDGTVRLHVRGNRIVVERA